AQLPNVGSPPPRRYRLPCHTPSGASVPVPSTVVDRRAVGPSRSRAVAAMYSFSTEAGGRSTSERAENSGWWELRAYTDALEPEPASASCRASSPCRSDTPPAAGAAVAPAPASTSAAHTAANWTGKTLWRGAQTCLGGACAARFEERPRFPTKLTVQ